ncbi:hypothetical protein IQ07DRAFT_649668 [Pyrenochaeta sp. DS3sAY3a]|nr:hypothetical protein IQ07DRAFT_649668 [Pyrenochaeta sp. DS3sAY3a]
MKVFYSISLFTSLATAIWPLPAQYDHGNTVLFIQKDVPFYVYDAGARNVGSIAERFLNQFIFASNSNSSPDEQDRGKFTLRKRVTGLALSENEHEVETGREEISGAQIVDYAINSAWYTIFKKNLYPWKFHPRGWSEPTLDQGSRQVSRVNIRLLNRDPPNVAKPLAGNVDESYWLSLTDKGIATISANTSVGIARGLTTFTQLFYINSNGRDIYTPLAPVDIRDYPKFAHRGLNLDVSRNFFPISNIKRQIDSAAFNKLNRLHLHVTDSQAWPLEIPSLPNLSRKGAYRPDYVYTANDFRELQRHAALQGVELITEIDMPGHTSSIHYSYPDLIAAFNVQPNWDTFAAEPPSGTLKLNSSAVYTFLDRLFADLLPRVYPYSSYFHTGGDEINKNAYLLDETVKSKDIDVLRPLLQKFVDRAHDTIRRAGLTPVVWEELLLEWNITLGRDVVVQSWRSDVAVAQIVQRGHKVLAGNYKYWYLDCGKGQWLDFAPSASEAAWPYNDYCAPFHNWRLAYSYDPLNGVSDELQHLVIGGEAHMWAEQTDVVNVERMVWPRASAVAEILWSGAKDAQGNNRSQIEASPRLSEMRERLVSLGVGAEPIQMPYCLMESDWGNSPQCQLGWGRGG